VTTVIKEFDDDDDDDDDDAICVASGDDAAFQNAQHNSFSQLFGNRLIIRQVCS